MQSSSNVQELKKTLEKNTVQLRKQNREEIFLKRRNGNKQTGQMDVQNYPKREKIVLDQRYRAIIEKALDKIYLHEKIQDYIKVLIHPDPLIRHEAIIGARKIIGQGLTQQKIQRYIDLGAVGILIELIKDKQFPHIQLEGCWILTNIASGTSAQCRSIIQKNGLEVFFDLLDSNIHNLVEQAIWTLGNIAGDCIKFRDLILQKNGLARLIKVTKSTKDVNILRYSAWAIANLTRGKPLPKYEIIKEGITVLGNILLGIDMDKEELSDCLWAISYNSQGQKTKIERIIKINGFVPYLINICKTMQESSIIIPALRILGNISNGNELQTEEILKYDIISLFNQLLNNQKKFIRRETCWIISNICAGIASQVHQIITSQELMSKVLRLFNSDQLDIRKEICYVFGNMVKYGPPNLILQIYMNADVLQGVVFCITQDDDGKAIQSGLQCFYNMLKLGSNSQPNPIYNNFQKQMGFFQRLEMLQHHENNDIYNLIIKIFQDFFSIIQPHSTL